jgi:hypothetical protein
MNEVRASVCSPKARRESSRYLGILLIGIITEFDGLMSGQAGSNVSIVGEGGREVGGVTFVQIFGLVLEELIICQSYG